MGVNWVGPALMRHGTPGQQRLHLPPIAAGEVIWCQGFSEPDAGSDLASLRTRAERDGDEFVITGHKVWTSNSDVAEWCFLLARTEPDVARHKGLSVFALPMDQPGVQQRPLKMINGVTREFGEVTLDGARVPADNMIGEPGEGWPLAMTILSHEREPHDESWLNVYLYSRAQSVMGGTSQIQRNLLATRVLGLPS
jgi:alkylation response protein AidB-like acyl-CoA dehydrogenase